MLTQDFLQTMLRLAARRLKRRAGPVLPARFSKICLRLVSWDLVDAAPLASLLEVGFKLSTLSQIRSPHRTLGPRRQATFNGHFTLSENGRDVGEGDHGTA